MGKLASEFELNELVGKRVKSLRDFNGVPKGMTGTVDEHYDIGEWHQGVMVAWDKPLAAWTTKPLRDGFGRDDDFDETIWLEVI